MKFWSTAIHALDPMDGVYKEFGGPIIEAPTKQMAHAFCQHNGFGYCCIGDEVVMQIPCKGDTTIPDWEKAIDYDKIEQN